MNKEMIFDFSRLLIKRFSRDRCLSHATNLSFTWLLSVVPLMTVSLAILAAFPVFEQITTQLQELFFSYFTPKSGSIQDVQKYFTEFSAKATQLTGVGILFLIVTALMLMNTIDGAFNEIWNVRVRRKPVIGFLVYWAVLTIGPLLVGVSLAVTSYLVTLPFFSSTVANVTNSQIILNLLPIIATSFAFTLMYMVIPNRSITFKHALLGGIVASVLFELAKRGFTLYVTMFPTYKFIYGALSTIPIFLIWIYISWVVVLLGAEITHCLSIFQAHIERKSAKNSELFELLDIIQVLFTRQNDGQKIRTKDLLKDLPLHEEYELLKHLDSLVEASIVKRTDTGEWVLVRSLDSYSLYDLYQACPCAIPVIASDKDLGSNKYPVLSSQLDENLKLTMAMTLRELYDSNEVART